MTFDQQSSKSMSGFFSSVLTDRSGKFNRQDEFAALSNVNDVDTYDFEDTYDGLGDELDEANDDFNDDTFGNTEVGKDFDFSGKTAKIANTIDSEQSAFQRHDPGATVSAIDGRPAVQPVTTNVWATRPQTSGDAGIWGQPGGRVPPTNYSHERSVSMSQMPAKPVKKVQTLAEIEASMLAARSTPSKVTPYVRPPQLDQQLPPSVQQSRPIAQGLPPNLPGYPPGYGGQGPQQRTQLPPGMLHVQNLPMSKIPGNPMSSMNPMPTPMTHPPQPRHGPIIQAPQPGRPPINLQDPSAEERAIRAAIEMKNLRRAQKIGQMARYNGVMSNGDKNYVLKVQISQLVSEDPEADDFYYTIHSQMRGRNNVEQGLGHFEQTYLHRAGQSHRRGNRDRQNPMLKMQQQVQKIIASAKTRPKSSSLAVEGSLGKLSFSRVRQPKQAINVKMPESKAMLGKQSRKEVLRQIELVYSLLLDAGAVLRAGPPPDAAPDVIAEHKTKLSQLDDRIWQALHIMDTVESDVQHPFIQLLQVVKGMKLVPRLYRGLSQQKRLTFVTILVAHLDTLDVVRLTRHIDSKQIPKQIQEEVDLFTLIVMPSVVDFCGDMSFDFANGLLQLLLHRNDIFSLCTTKIGIELMATMITRAEALKQSEQCTEQQLKTWSLTYNEMFSKLEGKFAFIFPPPSAYPESSYPWNFLATCAISASPEQQHILVNEVRDRVLENVNSANKIPRELAEVKRANVNLFLHAIGLDASQLES